MFLSTTQLDTIIHCKRNSPTKGTDNGAVEVGLSFLYLVVMVTLYCRGTRRIWLSPVSIWDNTKERGTGKLTCTVRLSDNTLDDVVIV